MMEIVFGDSAAGSLKMAQRYGEGKYRGGGIGVFVCRGDGREPTPKEREAARREAEEQARLRWERAVPMGGDTGDIYGFHLVLSVGDISEDVPGSRRGRAMEHLYGVYPEEIGRQAARELCKRAGENLEALHRRAAAQEPLRIWYSDHPDEACGLYWFMAQLERWGVPEAQVTMVKLPEWEADENGNIVRKCGWAEVSPGEWSRYVALQRAVPPVFQKSRAACWRELQRENAPLRAVLNGWLVSAPETLYNDFILREIEAAGEEFQEAAVVGRVLGKYQLGVGDAWVALRIEEMIRAGKLEAVSEAAKDAPVYHRLLRRRAPLPLR